MDLRCPRCAEPTDTDEIHDAVPTMGYENYTEALRAFQSEGCAAIWGGTPCERAEGGLYASALYDLLGDDSDGAAAMMEDFDFLFN